MKRHLCSLKYFAPVWLFLCFSGCDVTDHFVPPRDKQSGVNAPVIVTRTEVFSFAVEAERFTFGRSHHVEFLANNYALAVLLSGHRSGNAFIELRDQGGTVVRVDSLAGDTLLTAGHLMTLPPGYVTILLYDFTGTLSLELEPARDLQEFPLFHFPLRPGTTWVYRRVAAPYGTIDTVQIMAGQRYVLPDGRDAVPMFVDRSSSPVLGRTDTLHAAWGNGTLTILDTQSPTIWPTLIIQFPLHRGDAWPGRWTFAGSYFVQATNVVVKTGSVLGAAGSFDPVYIIEEHVDQGSTYGDACQWWLAPGVGIIRMRLHENYFVPPEYVDEWELLSYNPG